MFEAIHVCSPRMLTEGRAQYADPRSMIRSGSLLVEHIGFPDIARKLDKAMDICSMYEKKVVLTGRPNGATAKQLGDYILDTVADSKLESRWDSYVQK